MIKIIIKRIVQMKTICTLKNTINKSNLCRSQMTVKIDDETFNYLMNKSIINHHIFILGDWVDEFTKLYK
jgi:L-fucose isomerase-like protein